MATLPACLSLIFGLIALLTVFTCYKATGSNRYFAVAAAGWILAQSALCASGFYMKAASFIPGLILLVVPPTLLMTWLLVTRQGKSVLNEVDMHLLTVIHVIRAPTAMVLYGLYLWEVLPAAITFEKGNVDIIAGMTAPAAYYLGVLRGKFKSQMLVGWNLMGVGLLLNLIWKSLAAAPSMFQAGEAAPMPCFSYVLLIGVIIPVIFCSHFAAIHKLLAQRQSDTENHQSENLIFRQLAMKNLTSTVKNET